MIEFNRKGLPCQYKPITCQEGFCSECYICEQVKNHSPDPAWHHMNNILGVKWNGYFGKHEDKLIRRH